MALTEKQERNRTRISTHKPKPTTMAKFYQKQVDKAKEIYETGSYWNILCAQMQSGKTATAFFWALWMLFTGKVKRIYILSGSSDTELRNQWIKTFEPSEEDSEDEDSDEEGFATAEEDYEPEEVERKSDTLLTEFLMNYLPTLPRNVLSRENPHTLKDRIKSKIQVVFRQDITKKISFKTVR